MPSVSKQQQKFFGVVKAMQKGDIPKKGSAGKIAKTMDKDDVDDFASTKHKGLPKKVKREMKVKELIKKMVREVLSEKIGKGISFDNLKLGNTVKYSMGMDYKVVKLSSSKATLQLIHTLKNVNKSMLAKKFDINKRDFNNAIVDRQIRFITKGSAKVSEEKLTEKNEPSKAIKKVLDMADGGFGKLGGKTVDGLSANLFKAVYDKASDSNKAKIDKMNEKQLYVFMTKLWSKFGKQVKL